MSEKMTNDQNHRVVAITGGTNVPSRRFRIDALSSALQLEKIDLTELCPRTCAYPPTSKLLRAPWLFVALLERLTFLQRSKGYDAVILQREMISTLYTFERFLPDPLIFDVDDAVYLHRQGRSVEKISRLSSLIVCGNNYLAEVFSRWNSRVVVIPTGVDTDKLQPIGQNKVDQKIVGWIGTSANYRYLEAIEPALRKVLSLFPDARLQVISNMFPTFFKHFGKQLDFILWKPDIECELLPHFTVGIMPLIDSEWERGKCAFKMLQYMAAGIPVVASPVGVTKDILDQYDVGLSAIGEKQWVEAIVTFFNTPVVGMKIGMAGRKIVEEKYSLNCIAKQWVDIVIKLTEPVK